MNQATRKGADEAPFRVFGLLHADRTGRSTAGTASAARTAGAKVNGTVQLETADHVIYFDGLNLVQKVLIHQVGKPADFIRGIVLPRLIQSHRQAGPASASFVQENPDRNRLLSLKIIGNGLCRRFADFQHGNLLQKKWGLLF